MLRCEQELRTLQASASGRVVPDDTALRLDVLESEIRSVCRQSLWVDTATFDGRDLAQGHPSHESIAFNSSRPRAISPSSASMSAMIASGSRCSISSNSISW